MAKQIDDPSLTTFDATAVEGATTLIPASRSNVDGNIAIRSAALVPASTFATAAQGALADTALQPADTTRQKRAVSSASDPTVNDDSGDGYHVGQTWVNTTDDTNFVLLDATVGAAVWAKLAKDGDISDVGKTNLAADLDPPPGTMFDQDKTAYPTYANQDVQLVDCGGDINKSRVTVRGATPSVSSSCHWVNNPGGAKPTNTTTNDTWNGPVVGGRLTSVQSGSTLTLGPTLVGYDIRGTNATKLTVTLPSDASASFDVDVPMEIIRQNAVIEVKAGSGATINGVSNGRFEINTVFASAKIRKVAANTWRIEPGSHLTELAAGAEITYPNTAFNSHTIDGTDYVVTLTGPTSGAAEVGSVVVSGSDLDVWLLQIAAGGSGGRSGSNGAGGGSGGQVIEDAALTLTPDAYAFSINAPGAGVTSGVTAGNNGGDCVWDGATAAGGRGGAASNNGGVAGYNGSGAAANTGTSPTGGTGTGGFNGGAAFGSGTQALRAGGGGAGSGGNGTAGTSGQGGNGGQGFESAITGTALRYGAGGGGSCGTVNGADGTGSANYGSGSGAISGGNSSAGQRGAIILRFAIADCASEPQAV